MKNNQPLASSFRDPSGFMFMRDEVLYRQINHCYSEQYDHLMNSGLYEELTNAGLLVEHEEVDIPPANPDSCYKTIKPTKIPFISYLYEWPFSALKRAALSTLKIHEKALKYGMVLKDASGYNIQFVNAKPVFIDTLSFEIYHEGDAWVAYRQFCSHFLAPLALMAMKDIRAGHWLRIYMDGIPLDLASQLLPLRSYLKLSLIIHIHLHAKTQKRYAGAVTQKNVGESTPKKKRVLSQRGMLGLIDNLRSAIRGLKWGGANTEWAEYYESTNYSENAMGEKEKLVTHFLDRLSPKAVWDMGANNGQFSRLASQRSISTISFDIDPTAVEHNFLQCSKNKDTHMLPLILDITNPSPAIGWGNAERDSLMERGPVDTAFALALIHHLAISNNVPLAMVASFFAGICENLIIEFVPKSDSQVRTLLATRDDIFPHYTPTGFEKAFSQYFTIKEGVSIADSDRTLYLMKRI